MLEHLFLTPRRHPAPAREAAWLSAAQCESIAFDAGRSLPVYTWGEQGPVVLLVHGWAGRGGQLGAFAAPLRARGYRVVAFDAPAHGGADGRRASLPEFAEAVERVAAHVGPLSAVIAHSMGAAATTVALSRGLAAGRLVYLAPPMNPGDYLNLAAHYLGFGSAVARRTQARIERRFNVRFEWARGGLLAPGMTTPLKIFHDLHDAEVPYEDGYRLWLKWPGAELATTTGLGHRRLLRDAAVCRAVVDFLHPDVALDQPEPLRACA